MPTLHLKWVSSIFYAKNEGKASIFKGLFKKIDLKSKYRNTKEGIILIYITYAESKGVITAYVEVVNILNHNNVPQKRVHIDHWGAYKVK